jgi:hypothetical protein
MDIAAEVKRGDIIEALELASVENSAYFDTETGEVYTVSGEERELAEDEAPLEEIPDWELKQMAIDWCDENGIRYREN